MPVRVLCKVSIIASVVILLKSIFLLLVTALIVDIEIITLKNVINIALYLLALVGVGGFLWDLYTNSLLYYWFDLLGLKEEIERVEEGYGCVWLKSLTFWQWWREVLLFWKIKNCHNNSLYRRIASIILFSKFFCDVLLVLHIVMI